MQALARIPALRAVVDVRLPSGAPRCAARCARQSRRRCLGLTSHSEDDALFAVTMAGASGYLLELVSGLGAVRALAAGRSLLDLRAAAQVLDRVRRG